jgi:hypothetical protein
VRPWSLSESISRHLRTPQSRSHASHHLRARPVPASSPVSPITGNPYSRAGFCASGGRQGTNEAPICQRRAVPVVLARGRRSHCYAGPRHHRSSPAHGHACQTLEAPQAPAGWGASSLRRRSVSACELVIRGSIPERSGHAREGRGPRNTRPHWCFQQAWTPAGSTRRTPQTRVLTANKVEGLVGFTASGKP